MMKRLFKMIRRSESGQSATEYMLIVAVVVIGLVAAASKLIPVFRNGVETLGNTITEYLSDPPKRCGPNNNDC